MLKLTTASIFINSFLFPISTVSWNHHHANYHPIKSISEKKSSTLLSMETTPRETRILSPLRFVFSSAAAAVSSLPFSPAPAFAEGLTTLQRYFPTSLPIKTVPDILKKTLPSFTKANTLLCTSVCSDEVNADFVNVLTNSYGNSFTMGGLAGVPFVGTSGIGAAVSHIPDDGNLLVVVASHVGNSPDNILGKVKREGKEKLSGACGAAIGALRVIQKTGGASSTGNPLDDQEDFILSQLSKKKLSENMMSKEDSAIAWATYQVYDVAERYLKEELESVKNFPKENIAVLGGVLINMGVGQEDLFQPLLFKVGEEDVYEKAFGKKLLDVFLLILQSLQ